MTTSYTRLNKAIEQCEQVITQSPVNLDEWYDACSRIGNVLTSMGQFDQASQWSAMALHPEPKKESYYTKTASLYAIQENWQQSIECHTKTLEIDPTYAEAYRHLAQIHGFLGHSAEESSNWYHFLSHRPDQGTTERHYNLGKVLCQQGKLPDAEQCYRRSIEQDDQFWKGYYHLADVLLQQTKTDEAEAVYQHLVEHQPDPMQAYHKLGQLYLAQKNYPEAIIHFKQATQLDATFPWAYQGLVKTFMALERWDEAIATCRAIISFVEEFPWVYSLMGKVYTKKGEEMQAIACYQKGFQLQGWETCVQRDYQFTQDTFSHQIPIWSKSLQHLAHQENIRALEIGSGQGTTACWLLDNILSQPSAQLACIDRAFSEQFNLNIKHAQVDNDKVQRLEGKISESLKSLDAQTYNVAIIQDSLKQAKLMEQHARLCWKLLTPDAVVMFPSYAWKHPKDADKSPKVGIDRFLASVNGQFEVLHQGYQLIIKRNGSG